MCTVHFSKKYQLCKQSVLLAAVAVCAVHLAVGRVKAMVITEQANCLHIICISLLQLGNPTLLLGRCAAVHLSGCYVNS